LQLWLFKIIPVITVTYIAYIKNDYKAVIRYRPAHPWYKRGAGRLLLWGGVITAVTAYYIIPFTPVQSETEVSVPPVATESTLKADTTDIVKTAVASLPAPVNNNASTSENREAEATRVTEANPPPAVPVQWETVTVRRGDNLSLIFDRMGLSPAVLYQVLHTDGETKALKHLVPGQKLHFHVDDQGLAALKFDKSLVTTLLVQRDGDSFNSELVTTPLSIRVKEASATINDSLFLAGQEAGMSDNLIMQMVAIYGWDIDFVQDIRSGDHFKLIYQEQYKGGVKVKDGPILAAEFVNRGKAYRAVRYTSPDGHTDYYSENGASMRKAFLRTPVKFTRISSRFSLHRRHPILNTIRAHKGVDYAAPTGTPIKATGDGVVAFLGRKGGYGRAIVLKHGGRYSTLYGHMSAYARHLHAGSRVKQGQVIGYVGMSGLATGPHLHYEFRVNGVHHNPLTVKLPKAKSISKQYLADFKLKTATLLAELDQTENNAPTVLAMRDKSPDEPDLPANY
jgi:murein DD-endopeptidase MepM/ murein hydrolase activator NlpD